ncbi:hypothetical protein GCM10007216_18360 [Thalassobacillus devorans]|uniref:DUF402 domain-containing protein n=1 Tax=Thalassobacillus devorans TaxID=279813 RepID=A0ABQ1NZT7_9BACI|nr:hypothetical protein [Thalassobacillus devorans]GGC87948.1 hypothetical protein GCM10007216_18360 [Thalassobacillus devorans]
MIKEINGISISYDGRLLRRNPNKVIFSIEYYDSSFFNCLINIDLLNVDVVDNGKKWIYAMKEISDDQYGIHRYKYGEIVNHIHKNIVEFLQKYIDIMYDSVLIDHYSRVYKIS